MSFRHLLVLLTLLALFLPGAAAPPAWWATGNPPIITGGETNHRGPANIGQAKWMVAEALRALDSAAPAIALQIRADLAGTAPTFTDRLLDLTVPNPKPLAWVEAQKAPLLLGQLKAISAPFYIRLHAAHPTWLTAERTTNATHLPDSIFPWTTTPADDQNQAIATLGQLKAVFSLRFETLPTLAPDTDGDGMPDAWENAQNLNPQLNDSAQDPDRDGFSNLQEFQNGTNPHVANTMIDGDNDGIPDSWETSNDLSITVDDANLDPDGDGLTNLQEFQLGSNPNSADTDSDGLPDAQEAALGTSPTLSDTDADGLSDARDAVPDDPEIDWLKSSESRYVWIEQMTTPKNNDARLFLPVAVNSSGLILFPYYTVGEWAPSTVAKKNHLWDSAKQEWTDLPQSGSQAIEIEGGPTFTATDRVGGFIDINDAGTVSAIGRGHQFAPPSPTVGAHVIRTQPAMIWEKTGTPPVYGPPKYFIYHGPHPRYPNPISPGDTTYRDYCSCVLDISNGTHAGANYHWRSWRAPGGRVGIDGSMNLCAHIGRTNFSPVWLMRDGTSASPLLDQKIKQLGDSQIQYLSQVDYNGTFPGAILDKDHVLFVETLRDATTSAIWLKDGEDVTTITSVTPSLGNYHNHETDMIFAPSKKADNAERLWIAAGTKILLEKRAGGSGPGRWHTPPSMNEGALRLNARGEAITRAIPAPTAPALPTRPKLWRNGKYTDLNEVATKPDTVTITQAIDLASNGIILAQATENGVEKTGLLLPVEVKVSKEGETAAPEDGLIVKKSDTVRYRLSPGLSDTPLLLEDKVQWHWRILKWDGTYGNWTAYTNGKGHTFTAQPQDAGIYEVKATMDGQEFFFKRAKDDPHSAKKKDENECFGVVEQDWQINVRFQAKANLGSVAYAFAVANGNVDEDQYKCNLFVGHKASDGGATVPKINGNNPFKKYYPIANQWAGTQVANIPGWILLPVSTYPQPGYVVARGTPGGTGHTGFVDYDGAWIGAGTFNVNRKADLRNDISLRSGTTTYQPARFHKYTP